MESVFIRRISSTEKILIASANCGVNIAFRFLFRIDRAVSAALIDNAIKRAVENCKAVNLKYRGSKWYLSDYLPDFEFVESDAEDIQSHPISMIDHRKNSFKASGIYHKKTDTRYLSFEFLHGSCDGGAALSFICDVFALLDGRPLTKYVWNVTDHDIVKKHARQHTERATVLVGCKLKDRDGGTKARRYSLLTTTYKKGGVSGKLAYSVSQLFTKDDARIMIPVDLRKYLPESNVFCFGNLTLPLFHQCGGKDQARVSAEIREKIKNGIALSKHNSRNFYLTYIPMPIVDFIIKSYRGFLKRRKSFILCAIVSYMGEVDSSRLKNPYFDVTDVIVQAEKYPYCAFDTFSIGFDGHLNVGITCENGQIEEKICNKLMENIKANVN